MVSLILRSFKMTSFILFLYFFNRQVPFAENVLWSTSVKGFILLELSQFVSICLVKNIRLVHLCLQQDENK